MLLAKKDKDEQVLLAEDQAWIESSSDSNQEINANMVFMAQIENVLSDSEANSSSADENFFEKRIEKANQQSKDFENQNKDLQDKYDVLKNQETTFEMNNKELNGQLKELIEKNNDLLAQTKVLKDQLQVKHVVIDTHVKWYTLMFLTHSDEALEIKKFKRSRENKIEFVYDYGNLNATNKFTQTYVPNVILEKILIDLEDEVVNLLEKEKVNLETIESLKSKGFESSENVSSELENQTENDCLVVEKEYDKEKNPKVITPGMFKLNMSQCVSPISMSKSSCESNNVEIKLKRKRRKRKSSRQNVKQVDNDVLCANNDFVYFSDLDTFSSVRTKNSSVVWKKKGSSNTSNVGLSAVSVSKLNKNVKQYSCKDLLACNNSHLGETRSDFVYNDAMNVSCDSRMNDLLDDNNFFIFDDNNFFIFDDINVRISSVSKMPFRKKPRDSMHHMTGNRALLTIFVEKFLRTVQFGNNDFAVISGYGDVVIGFMMIKKIYYVEGLGHNLFSVGQFCDKGIEVAFRKSTCFVRNEDDVDLLTGDRSSNLYTIALNEVASNSLTYLLAKASSS
nr:integrase, catalytic region, zinc finger, CCHC-type, peptidase aspartic, catalytic [Tanacetum cinerariifolium]